MPYGCCTASQLSTIRRFSTRCLAAYAIDDHEEAAPRITIESILVDRALTARVGLTGSYECIDSSHLVTLVFSPYP